ncbi:MAG: trypsin-like peptidase domain-containing protein [Myxococcales bacterium]|nr:trypsin-like peptidase domain-containing protein [Myxococcales bacterium]
MTILMAAAFGTAAAEPTRWQRTLDEVVQAVVSIRVTATRDFDTEDAGVSQGTGFVVDAERGLVLTNRHMVHAGPVVAEGVFLNSEEVELRAIYRDPVHDFGLYQFDPSTVRHTSLVELPLAPDGARVGTEIRVVGNDAGEKISILDGTLSRLDRNAPNYGQNSYNDFNTFYIQAASNTSGGSSGSPVVDLLGRAVALNAGGSVQAASSFYLPLDRVVRALDLIQEGQPVTRGTLQTVFVHTPFDELGRLGLQEQTEATVRRSGGPDLVGMLVVKQVLPEGPADGKLRPGDVLVRIDGELVTDFVSLESTFDDSVGATLKVEVERGGTPVTLDIEVGDLHAITPSSYLEVGRGVLNPLSYHQARNHNLAVQGVYVAVSGYMWATADVPEGAVVTHIDGVEVPDLDALRQELQKKGDGQRIRVRFFLVHERRQPYETVAVMDRRWYPMLQCSHERSTGLWPCEVSPPPPVSEAPEPAAQLPLTTEDRVARKVARSLVMVEFDIPHPTAGVKDLNYVGAGTIIDSERGLLLVDRDTVPVGLGDLSITFAGSVRVPGRLEYLHPVHNYAVLSYDPALLGGLEVQAVQLAEKGPAEEDKVWLVGLNGDHVVVSQKTRVKHVDHLHMGASNTPRVRDSNMVGIWLEEAVDSYGGVVVDRRGEVVALWASFLDQRQGGERARGFYGMPVEFLQPVVGPILEGRTPDYRILGVEVVPLSLAQARDRGLSDARVKQLLDRDPDGRKVFEILRIHGRSPAKEELRPTDLVLEVDGRILTDVRSLERLQRNPSVRMTVLRDASEVTVEVPTFAVPGRSVDRVVSWAGLIVHEPHFEVEAQKGIEAEGAYIAWLWYGSPAQRYGIRPTRRIVQVDDVPTPDLDSFLAAVRHKRDREPVRLLLEKADGSEVVQTLKLDLHYWPTQVLQLVDGDWQRRQEGVSAGGSGAVDAAPQP